MRGVRVLVLQENGWYVLGRDPRPNPKGTGGSSMRIIGFAGR